MSNGEQEPEGKPAQEGEAGAEQATGESGKLAKADPPKSPAEELGIPAEILEGIPAEARQIIERSLSLSIFGSIGRQPPFADKVTSDHITKVIDNAEKDSLRDSEAERRIHWMTFGVVIALFVFVGVLLFAPNPTPLAQDVIKVAIGLVTGGLAGYGLGRKAK
jgi:hypothetical protein